MAHSRGAGSHPSRDPGRGEANWPLPRGHGQDSPQHSAGFLLGSSSKTLGTTHREPAQTGSRAAAGDPTPGCPRMRPVPRLAARGHHRPVERALSRRALRFRRGRGGGTSGPRRRNRAASGSVCVEAEGPAASPGEERAGEGLEEERLGRARGRRGRSGERRDAGRLGSGVRAGAYHRRGPVAGARAERPGPAARPGSLVPAARELGALPVAALFVAVEASDRLHRGARVGGSWPRVGRGFCVFWPQSLCLCFPDVSAAASLFSHSLVRRPRLLFPKKKRSLFLSQRIVRAQSRKPGAVLDAGASAGPALSEGASSRGFEPCQLVGVYFVWCPMPSVTSSVLGGERLHLGVMGLILVF